LHYADHAAHRFAPLALSFDKSDALVALAADGLFRFDLYVGKYRG
jgi:hypothetical protein